MEQATRFYNWIEAGLWIVFGLGLLIWLLARRDWSGHRWWAVPVLIVFGISDVIEVHTGAWWRPRWLLVMKVACIIAGAILGYIEWRGKKH